MQCNWFLLSVKTVTPRLSTCRLCPLPAQHHAPTVARHPVNASHLYVAFPPCYLFPSIPALSAALCKKPLACQAWETLALLSSPSQLAPQSIPPAQGPASDRSAVVLGRFLMIKSSYLDFCSMKQVYRVTCLFHHFI